MPAAYASTKLLFAVLQNKFLPNKGSVFPIINIYLFISLFIYLYKVMMSNDLYKVK